MPPVCPQDVVVKTHSDEWRSGQGSYLTYYRQSGGSDTQVTTYTEVDSLLDDITEEVVRWEYEEAGGNVVSLGFVDRLALRAYPTFADLNG